MTNLAPFKSKHFLIIDASTHIPFGRQYTQALCELGLKATYLPRESIRRKILYSLRRSIKKRWVQYQAKEKVYYYHPKFRVREFEQKIEELKPDFIIVIAFSFSLVGPKTWAKLKQKYGFKLFLWDTDSANIGFDPKQFTFFLNQELVCYDKIFTFSNSMEQIFKQIGFDNIHWLPYGAEPVALKPKHYKRDLCFVGIPNLRRIFLINKLAHYSITLAGGRWLRYQDYLHPALKNKIIPHDVYGEKLTELLCETKIVLNITNTEFFGLETGANLRVFEALAHQSFLLTDDYPEIHSLFNVGHDLVTFRDSHEFIEKIDYYLRHDEEREQIAHQGYERFLKDYTWQKRAMIMLDEIQF